jgi:hypothetical protein
MFGKTHIKCFYQTILNMISTQDEISFINSKPSNTKSTHESY